MATRFTPAAAECLTGVSASLQRKWVQLHFSSMLVSDWQWEVSSGGHRRYTWGGIQLLVFFRDVIGDLGASFSAEEFVNVPPGSQRGCSNVLPQSHVFENDFREYERGDLYLWRTLVEGSSPSFQTVLASAVHNILADAVGSRLYLYNVSAMQRDLLAKCERLQDTSGILDKMFRADL